MEDTIDPTFEFFVSTELGDIAVVSNGKYVSPKIQSYYKVWLASKELAEAQAPVKDTPPSNWSLKGDRDPHEGRYDCCRKDLAMSDLTDDELANGAFMNYDVRPPIEDILAGTRHSPIAWMTAVKDRIRWLSRKLSACQQLADTTDLRDLLSARSTDSYSCKVLVRDVLNFLDRKALCNVPSRPTQGTPAPNPTVVYCVQSVSSTNDWIRIPESHLERFVSDSEFQVGVFELTHKIKNTT